MKFSPQINLIVSSQNKDRSVCFIRSHDKYSLMEISIIKPGSTG